MTGLVGAALTVLGALVVMAAQPPLPGVQAEPTAEGSVVRIRNAGPVSLAAFVVEMVGYPGNRFRMEQDEVTGMPIGPGESRDYATDAKMPGTVPEYLKVRAAIYVDGTTVGAPESIAEMLAERGRNLRGVRAVVSRLEKALGARMDAAGIIADLERWRDSAEPGVRQAAGMAIARLRTIPATRVLEDLRRREKALADSKPTLP